MKLSNLYNSTKNKVGGVTGKISDYFSNLGKTSYTAPVEMQSASVNAAVQAPPVPQIYKLADRGAELTEDDIEKMRPLIYGEVSNRPYDKKALEADVIFNTAINRQREYSSRGQNRSISDIVAMPNQYQAYNGNQYQTYYNPKNPVDVAKKKEVDAIVDAIAEKIRKGQYIDNTEGAFYYIHEDDSTIKYDNIKKLFAQ